MAGHSKWANIQHRKGRQDERRARLFSRLIREVSVSARMGGGDSSGNPRLRAAVDAAHAANIPRDTVQRSIDKATGNADDGNIIEEVRYEGYGPAGVAFVVDCQTDNRNRTVGEVRHAFAKSGGNLGTEGSVWHMFRRCSVFSMPIGTDSDALFECVAEAGAEDLLENEDGSVDIIAPMEAFAALNKALQDASFKPSSGSITTRVVTHAQIGDDDAIAKALSLYEKLDEIDDVQNVYCNLQQEIIDAYNGDL